jgi:hypothetical protein
MDTSDDPFGDGLLLGSDFASHPWLICVSTPRFNGNQGALISLAKDSKNRGGVSRQEADILIGWAKEYGLPWRGPEVHPRRKFNEPHIHIGPINHIPVK